MAVLGAPATGPRWLCQSAARSAISLPGKPIWERTPLMPVSRCSLDLRALLMRRSRPDLGGLPLARCSAEL